MNRFTWLERYGLHVVWGMVVLYVAGYFSVCVTKFRYYLYTDFDLALFTQAAHQILRGSLWNSIRGMNWIGDHSSLVLFLVAPSQAIWPGPLSMLFVQTAALALGGVAAWRLARHEGLAEPAPVLFAAVYLLHPAIGYTNLFEFHPEVLSTSALLFVFLALRTGGRGSLVAWALLALLGKEDVALPVFMMGLYALTLRRPGTRGDAALLVGLATASLVLSFAWLKPAFNQGDVDYGEMYRHLGNSTGQRVVHVLTQPAEILAALVSAPGDPTASAIKWTYYLHMLGPLLFLPLASPLVLLIAGPTLAEHMLSNRSPQHSIVFQYTAYVTPILFAAAILGAKQVEAWLETRVKPGGQLLARAHAARSAAAKRARAESPWQTAAPFDAPPVAALPGPGPAAVVAGTAMVVAMACQAAFGPFGVDQARMPVQPFERTRPDARERTDRPIRDRLAARVPPEGGVVASFQFMPSLSTRPIVHSAHHVIRGRFTYSKRLFPIPTGVVAFLADMSHPTLVPFEGPTSANRMSELFRKNGLRPVEAIGDHLLFLTDARDTVELVTARPPAPTVPQEWTVDGQLQCAGFDSVGAKLAAGEELRFRTHWRRVGAAQKLYLMDLMLVDPEGNLRAHHVRPLGYCVSPVSSWPEGEVVCEQGRWVLSLDTPPGDYVLAIALRPRDGKTREAEAPNSAADPRLVPIGFVTVTAPGATSPPRAPE